MSLSSRSVSAKDLYSNSNSNPNSNPSQDPIQVLPTALPKAKSPKDLPKVIYLDAFGTLFGLKGSVGDLYSNLARTASVITDPHAVNQAFYQSFGSAESMAFPNVAAEAIPELEYRWWQAVVSQTFEKVGALDQFTDFDSFYAGLYGYFETAAPWRVYGDTLAALKRWQSMGIELGIISNFDSRLYRVLDVLGLRPYFQSVTISTEVGAAKPSAQIFQAALQKHHCKAQEAWHIGDSQLDDYSGARAAGLHAILLDR
ncbi:MAG: putative hydrolase of the HAD superfamily [Phormidesmis priestleyi Ana]|uniref:Putative hydrolase of the HAD superfamily n=1 Tax=Phormidesmis priestleyi Ana TaxID=1666911 RepID=A0A0P8BQP6_9CYAN|nr:MAG: putative hydrolase of the HAD superfamily [Phormidesmis priestleyi Ana]